MRNDPIIKEKPRPSSGNRMQVNLIIFLVLAIGLMVAVPYHFLSKLKGEEFVLRTYEYSPVKTRTFVRKITVVGNVQPTVAVEVETATAGVLEKLEVQLGQDISSGQIVGRLDLSGLEDKAKEVAEAIAKEESIINELSIDYEIQQRNNLKTLANLEKELESARQNLVLKERLYEIGSISRKELEDAQGTVTRLEDDLISKPEEFKLSEEKVQGKLDTARKNLEKNKKEYADLLAKLENNSIVSPIAGRVIEIKAGTGTQLAVGSKILKVVDMASSVIVIYVEESNVSKIYYGQEAEVEVGGSKLIGKITYISPQTTNISGQGPSVEVHVSLDQVPENIRANSTATVNFEVERRDNVPYLRRGPYLTSGEYSFVYVREGDKATRKSVTFGYHDGEFVEVVSGLNVGQEVITTSYEEYKEKPEIAIIPEGGRLR